MRKLNELIDQIESQSECVLHKTKGFILIENDEVSCDVESIIAFLPTPRVFIRCRPENVKQMLPKVSGLRFKDSDIQIPGFVSNSNFRFNDGASAHVFEWTPSKGRFDFIGPESSLTGSHVDFCLFNYPLSIGTSASMEQNGSTSTRIVTLSLECDQWQVKIDSHLKTYDYERTFEASGQKLITHTGVIKSADSKPISVDKCKEYLSHLRYFLSMTCGSWMTPCCPVLVGADGGVNWQQVSAPSRHESNARTMFDSHQGVQIANFFTLFMKKWSDPTWRDVLEEPLYWYMASLRADRNIESCIVLTQTALEKLAFELVVNQRSMLTKKGYLSLWASDRIRLLLTSLNIPFAIPRELVEINAANTSNNRKWVDAPHAFTEIRNSIIHPDKQDRLKDSNVYFEAWQLGLWLVELCILRLCDYSGTYANRLRKTRHVGEHDELPV